MDSLHSLLARPHLSVITRHADPELARIQDTIDDKALVDGRAELEELFGRLLSLRCEPLPKTLDLIGHSTPHDLLLQLGDWAIDASSPTVTAYFRELADNDVLPRLGIHSLRLLGCRTADTESGRRTVCTLSDLLGLEVYGTNSLVCAAHYDANGFSYDRRYMLICSSDLRRERDPQPELPNGTPYPRTLDVDALPTSPLAVARDWPVRIAAPDDVRRILALIRRNDGATMPGLLAVPACEVAMTSASADLYHRAQVLLDGEFVRVYPDGDAHPGVMYPVDDPGALCAIVDALPILR